MTSYQTDLADAITADLAAQAGTFSVTPDLITRSNYPVDLLDDLTGTALIVFPLDRSTTHEDRDLKRRTVRVGALIAARLASGQHDAATEDALIGLAEEIDAYLEDQNYTAAGRLFSWSESAAENTPLSPLLIEFRQNNLFAASLAHSFLTYD